MRLHLHTVFLVQFILFITSCCCSETKNKACSNLCYSTGSTCYMPQVSGAENGEDNSVMKYYIRNSTECSSLDFNGNAETDFPSTIQLKSYMYVQQTVLRITAFNLSFTNIEWNFLRFRFQQNGNEKGLNYCRDFTILPGVQIVPTYEMFWDCLWSDSAYQKSTINFEVIARRASDGSLAYRRFTFSVPDANRIDPSHTDTEKWEVFMYIDVSSPKKMILNFQTIPGVVRYLVTMQGKNSKDDKEIEATEGGTVQIPFDTPISGYPYQFIIQPLGEKCKGGCAISKSPPVTVIEDHLALGLYLFLGCIVLILVVTCLYVKRRIVNKQAAVVKPPVVLFIYKSTHKSHVNVIDKLCAYLESRGIIVLLDRRDIQKSENKDPYHWFLQSFEQADAVLIFSSLQCCPNDTIGIHRRVDDAAIIQLKTAVADKKHRFARVLLPYCSPNDIPVEASKFKLISLPNDINELTNFVKVNTCINRIVTVLNTVDKDADGILEDLKKSIRSAGSELENHKKMETPQPPLTLNISNDYLNDDDEGTIRYNEQVGQNSPGSSTDENVYPNLDHMNLMGEDFSQLIPPKDRQNDDFSNVKFSEMKL